MQCWVASAQSQRHFSNHHDWMNPSASNTTFYLKFFILNILCFLLIILVLNKEEKRYIGRVFPSVNKTVVLKAKGFLFFLGKGFQLHKSFHFIMHQMYWLCDMSLIPTHTVPTLFSLRTWHPWFPHFESSVTEQFSTWPQTALKRFRPITCQPHDRD